MSKKQTRRSVSISGGTYDRLMEYAGANGTSGSRVVEDRLREFFEMPDGDQRAAIAQIPQSTRKYVPKIVMKTDMDGRPIAPKAKEVVITTPVLEKNGDWVEKSAAEPADAKYHEARVQVIKVAHAKTEKELAVRQESGLEKKKGRSLDDLASKIFTF